MKRRRCMLTDSKYGLFGLLSMVYWPLDSRSWHTEGQEGSHARQGKDFTDIFQTWGEIMWKWKSKKMEPSDRFLPPGSPWIARSTARKSRDLTNIPVNPRRRQQRNARLRNCYLSRFMSIKLAVSGGGATPRGVLRVVVRWTNRAGVRFPLPPSPPSLDVQWGAIIMS